MVPTEVTKRKREDVPAEMSKLLASFASMDPDAAMNQLGTSAAGLTNQVVEGRLVQHGPNEIAREKRVSPLSRLSGETRFSRAISLGPCWTRRPSTTWFVSPAALVPSCFIAASGSMEAKDARSFDISAGTSSRLRFVTSVGTIGVLTTLTSSKGIMEQESYFSGSRSGNCATGSRDG